MMLGHPSKASLKVRAGKDLASGRADLLRDLKRTSGEDLHKVDPALLLRLSPEQRAEFFAHAARRGTAGRMKQTAAPSSRRHGGPFLLRRLWNRLPLVLRAQGVALGLAVLGSALTTPLFQNEDRVRAVLSAPDTLPAVTTAWPYCPRLTPYTDGCIYSVRNSLTWQEAAAFLALSPETLRNTNQHLGNSARLQAGNDLIIWRGQIPLEN